MPDYDGTHFDPPAPVASVKVRNPDNGATASGIRMLIDSGADVTLVPRSALVGVGIEMASVKHYELMGFDGTISQTPAVRLEMIFHGRTFRGQFLLIDSDWGIVGRDVINLLSLMLNGPKQTWELLKL